MILMFIFCFSSNLFPVAESSLIIVSKILGWVKGIFTVFIFKDPHTAFHGLDENFNPDFVLYLKLQQALGRYFHFIDGDKKETVQKAREFLSLK